MWSSCAIGALCELGSIGCMDGPNKFYSHAEGDGGAETGVAAALNSSSSAWQEHMALDWEQHVVRRDLLRLRDLLLRGLTVHVVQERVTIHPPHYPRALQVVTTHSRVCRYLMAFHIKALCVDQGRKCANVSRFIFPIAR